MTAAGAEAAATRHSRGAASAKREHGALAREIAGCRLCPRLVEWREAVAADPPRRHRGEPYWARPLPGFGDPAAAVVVVGLAPAAHGANRTGRLFTGDRSGDWLFGAMHRAGLANKPESISADDGLRLRGAWVTAVNRCAPPANKPTPAERDTCLPYLVRELELLRPRAGPGRPGLLCVGRVAARAALGRLRGAAAEAALRPRRRGRDRAGERLGGLTLLGCFHPSQQNTFTGRLTEPMIDAVFSRAVVI